jgi:hypothetical protein
MSKAISEARRQECIKNLREWIKPGDTVYAALKHVSRSGMYRVINLFVIKDEQPIRLDGWAADLLEGYDQRHNGLRAHGCGMDMGFHLVYNLGCALFKDGFECIGKRCPSSDHSNGERNYEPHHHKNGGYALRQQWL